ncbi:MAG: hypothetical protein WBC71_03895 [Salaquimonas sp.]
MKITKIIAASAIALTMTVNAKAADIVDTAVAAGSFNTLVAAVQAAGRNAAGFLLSKVVSVGVVTPGTFMFEYQKPVL